jgi:hypothetical protein
MMMMIFFFQKKNNNMLMLYSERGKHIIRFLISSAEIAARVLGIPENLNSTSAETECCMGSFPFSILLIGK